MFRLKHINNVQNQLRAVVLSSTKCKSTAASGVSVAEERIVVPKRIERRPTDILHALSNTVGTDHTAPHFKYHDDPYLIPKSQQAKRNYIMSKEAGRKAAQWVRQEHPDLFQVNNIFGRGIC